jgi:histidinol dehydrogenase
LDEAIRSVEFFHKKCLPEDWLSENQHGAVVGEKYDPIQRVGIYIPGGQVPLVSTVIMTVTLAKIAGVPEIVVVTPPRKDGSIHPYLLAAMSRIGVKEIYRMGGIQAVGALAFGTETVPSVDKIFGPGNAYVMEAKRQVLGVCGMDLLPGPSEIMVIGDETANPAYIAADLLAQAEHGSGKEKVFWASVGNHSLKDQVILEINKQIQTLSHKEKIRYIIEEACILIQCENIDQAISAANKIAPEHLELHLSKLNEDHCIEKILTAGCMLLGEMSPTVLGDFVAGPSHTLPTGTSGRFFSGLRLEDFMRRTSLIRYSRESANLARGAVKAFSEMEQLDAHGNSLEIRFHRS